MGPRPWLKNSLLRIPLPSPREPAEYPSGCKELVPERDERQNPGMHPLGHWASRFTLQLGQKLLLLQENAESCSPQRRGQTADPSEPNL